MSIKCHSCIAIKPYPRHSWQAESLSFLVHSSPASSCCSCTVVAHPCGPTLELGSERFPSGCHPLTTGPKQKLVLLGLGRLFTVPGRTLVPLPGPACTTVVCDQHWCVLSSPCDGTSSTHQSVTCPVCMSAVAWHPEISNRCTNTSLYPDEISVGGEDVLEKPECGVPSSQSAILTLHFNPHGGTLCFVVASVSLRIRLWFIFPVNLFQVSRIPVLFGNEACKALWWL